MFRCSSMSARGDGGGCGDGYRQRSSAIPHDQLMRAVEERICDRSVSKLLRVMLRAG